MILVAGGTGRLGTRVTRLLTARELEVRILTRDPARARHLEGDLVEIVSGDVRDPRVVEQAAAGARTALSRRSTGLPGPAATVPGRWMGRGTAT